MTGILILTKKVNELLVTDSTEYCWLILLMEIMLNNSKTKEEILHFAM